VPNALDQILRRAGAVIADRGGIRVAISYGSAAGELAACVTRAGIADSSQLTKLELTGPPAAIAELVRRATGSGLAPGGVINTGQAWWCGADGCASGGVERGFELCGPQPERVIVLCEPQLDARTRSRLSARIAALPAVELRDRSLEWSAITVLGAATAGVLDSLGVFGPCGDPRHVPPFTSGRLAGVDALWLLASEHRAIALTSSADADIAWHEIERAGRPLQMCCVGQEAVSRYSLLQRA
jgi:glycine cleavage system aminomethyltransferase T